MRGTWRLCGLAQGAEIAGELTYPSTAQRSALSIRFAASTSTLLRLQARPGLVQDVPAASKQGLEGDPSDRTSSILVTLELQQSVYGMPARTVIGVSRQC